MSMSLRLSRNDNLRDAVISPWHLNYFTVDILTGELTQPIWNNVAYLKKISF